MHAQPPASAASAPTMHPQAPQLQEGLAVATTSSDLADIAGVVATALSEVAAASECAARPTGAVGTVSH